MVRALIATAAMMVAVPALADGQRVEVNGMQ